MKKAFEEYIKEVSDGTFPAKEHCFSMDDSILEKLY
jgi:3-methyl-2-oxobutanoate hydroxymethyltransferase